jgi:2-isopropylmalate synthase
VGLFYKEKTMPEHETVKIFDTTLRDGEQSPGATMTLKEKILIAETLDRMGVDIIEAGFAIASKGDFEAVNEIAKAVKNSTVCSLARAKKEDIEAAGKALEPANNKRIHTFISTSDIHMKHKLNMSREAVLEAIAMSVSYAKTFTDDVEWSAEDATRTDHDFLCQAVEVAIENGATTVNIPDTVGYTAPQEYAELIAMLKKRVPGIDDITISVHCHNDLGLAVANSLSAVNAGARQIECTINGLGERAGNAALEEVVMAINTRGDLFPYKTAVDTTHITRASRLVSTITGFIVQNNKAIVGANAFAHESGIHQDGMLKNRDTYEIMTPESIGLTQSELVMGKHSGRHAFKEKLNELGINLGDNAFQQVFADFKSLADKKKYVYDEDIIALIDNGAMKLDSGIGLKSLSVACGSDEPSAEVSLTIDGKDQSITCTGDGPVDAIFNGIKSLVPHEGTLVLYQVHAVTGGTDAQAEVTARLQKDGRMFSGNGVDTDTLVASAKAYINAVNKLNKYDNNT